MRRIVAVAGIAALSLGWAAMPAGAGTSAHFVSTPDAGPPGTTIHNSGNGEFDGSNCLIVNENVHVEVFDAQENSVAQGDTTTNEDLSWAVDVTMPTDAADGAYIITAFCTDGDSRGSYVNNTFTVTAPVVTTTTSTASTTSTTVAAGSVTTTTTTTTTVPVVVTPAATPAPAVVASPALTG
jgi:hypothetical protein